MQEQKWSHNRRHNATHVPESLLQPGLLPIDLQDQLDMHKMKSEQRVFLRKGCQIHFSNVWLDEDATRSCHKEMQRLQELILKSEKSKILAKNEKTGDLIYLSISTKQAGLTIQPNSTFQRKWNSNNDPDIREMIRTPGSLVSNCFESGYPQIWSRFLRREVSMMFL